MNTQFSPQFEQALSEYVNQIKLTSLRETIAYALLDGGKRLRPSLVFASAQACYKEASPQLFQQALPAAMAIELVHNYSLIHDDLPAMDNDFIRRGKPSVHAAFGEARAILAGDSLLTDAFALLAKAPLGPAEQVYELARAAGSNGMVAGQEQDIFAQATFGDTTSEEWEEIHALKTGSLFSAASALGGLSVNASAQSIETLRKFGHLYGIAYQLRDDLVDNDSTANVLDAEDVQHALRACLQEAKALLSHLEGNTSALMQLVHMIDVKPFVG